MQRSKKDRIGISSVRARIHAAIEAEAAAVPQAEAEIIDHELSRIMSSRPAVTILALADFPIPFPASRGHHLRRHSGVL